MRSVLFKSKSTENVEETVDKAIDVNTQEQVGDPAAALSVVDFDQEIKALQENKEDQEENLLDQEDTDLEDGATDDTSEESSEETTDETETQDPQPEAEESEESEEEQPEDPEASSTPEESEAVTEGEQIAAETLIHAVVSKISMASEAISKASANGYVSPVVKRMVDQKINEACSLIGAPKTRSIAAENQSSASFFARIKQVIKMVIEKIKEWVNKAVKFAKDTWRDYGLLLGKFEKNIQGYKQRLEAVATLATKKSFSDWSTINIEMPCAVTKNRDEIESVEVLCEAYNTFNTNLINAFSKVPSFLEDRVKNMVNFVFTNGPDALSVTSTPGFERIVEPSSMSSLLTRGVAEVKIFNKVDKEMSAFDINGLLGLYNMHWTYRDGRSGPLVTADDAIRTLSMTSFELIEAGKREQAEATATPEYGIYLADVASKTAKNTTEVMGLITTISQSQQAFAVGLKEISDKFEETFSGGTMDDSAEISNALRVVTTLLSAIEACYIQPLRAVNKVNTGLLRSMERAIAAIVASTSASGLPGLYIDKETKKQMNAARK